MNKADCFFLGTITKLHGYSGELHFFLDVDQPENYKTMTSLLIEVNDDLIPFFVQKITIHPKAVIVKLEDVDNEEQAAKLVNCDLYLPLSQLPPLTGKRFYFHEVIGFTVIDALAGELGPIARILDMPQQAVIEMPFQGKEVLIPVSDAIVERIDREQKKFYVNIPEGLLEIYL